LRVTFVSVFNIDSGGGINSWLSEVAPRLSRRMEVSVLTSDRGNRVHPLSDMLKGVDLIEKPIMTLSPSKSGLFTTSLVREFASSNVVYLCSNSSLFARTLCVTLQDISGTPVIASHHNETGQHDHRTNYVMLRLGGPLIDRMMYAHHALNQGTVSWLKEIKAKRIYKIPNGVNTQNFLPSSKKARFTILFLGRHEYEKGIDRIPPIVNLVKHYISNFEILVGGTGSLTNAIRQNISNSNVTWLGQLNDLSKKTSVVLAVPPNTFKSYSYGI